MSDKVISATLKVNTGTSAADIEKINEALKATGVEVETVEEGGKKATSSFNTLKDGLGKLPGPLGAVKGGIDTVQSSLKALAANPIVLVVTLLVAALVALYKAFASTESGAEKIEQIFAGLGAIVTVIRDRILALAGAVVSFFKGDFKAAIEQTKAAVTGVGDAITKAYTQAADATRMLQEAQDELNRGLTVSRAKLNRDLAATKELISDETASYGDRKKAIETVRAAEEVQTQAELDNANKTLTALGKKLALDKENSDLQDEYAKQQAHVYEIQEQQAQTQRSLNKQNHQLDQQEQQKAQQAAQKAHEADLKRLAEKQAAEKAYDDWKKGSRILMQEGIVTESQMEADALEQKRQQAEEQKKIDEERYTNQKDILSRHTSDLLVSVKKEKDAREEQAQYEAALAQFRIDTAQKVGAALGALADLIGKQTIAGKALAIAQATINTWLGVTEVLATKTTLPEPLATINRVASIVTVIAAGLSAVRNIVKVNPSSGGGSAAGSLSVAAPTASAAPIAPQQAGTAIDQASIAGIGNAVSGRAYVLAQDVTHDQDRNERLNRCARLGN